MTMNAKKALCMAMSAIMLLSAMPMATFAADVSESVNDGLLAYYDFEGLDEYPSEIADASGKGNDATVLNNVGWGVDHRIKIENGAAVFPGASYLPWGGGADGAALRLPADIINGVSDFTVSMWVNADSSYEFSDKMERFFDFGNIGDNDATNSFFARYTPSSGLLRIADRKLGKDAYTEETISDKPFTDKWGLFTFTYEKGGNGYYMATTYVNGSLRDAMYTGAKFTRPLSALGTLTDDSNGLFIGRTVWTATGQEQTDNPDFCGKMDEVRIYNRALKWEEVMYLYENTSPVGKIAPESAEVPDVTTEAGNYPELPETLKVTYTTGAVREEKVTWEDISSEKYAEAGTFYVKGVTESGLEVRIKVIVIKDEGILNEGLIAYYSFDTDEENPSEILDISGHGNNAKVYNMSQTVFSGGGPWGGGQETEIENRLTVSDGVAYFPGSKIGSDFGLGGRERNTYYNGAAIKLPNGINEGVQDFTYSAWICADTSYRYNSARLRLFDFGRLDSDYNSFYFRYIPSSGDSRFQDRAISSESDGDNPNSMISATLSDKPFNDKWAMLTVVYKNNGSYYTPTVYINGEERFEYDNSLTTMTRSLASLDSMNDNTNGLWIGRTQWENSDNPDFCGKMDEIRLYERALSAQEVKALYEAKKPSDEPIDCESLPQTKVTATEDTNISGYSPDGTYADENPLCVSSTNGARYNRHALFRFDVDEGTALSAERAVLRLYCETVSNSGTNSYYLYGLVGNADGWDENTVTMNNYESYIGGTISGTGEYSGGNLIDTQTASADEDGVYMTWDITEFIQRHAGESYSFLLTTSSNAADFTSAEASDDEKKPAIIIYRQGTPVTVRRVTENGEEISTSTVYATEGESYTYNIADGLITYDNTIYAADKASSQLTVSSVSEGSEVIVRYKKAENLTYENIEVLTYIGKAPTMPRVVSVSNGEYTAMFAADWENVDAYSTKGERSVTGNIRNADLEITALVRVFPEYNGAVGGDLTIEIYLDGELSETRTPPLPYGQEFTLTEEYETFETYYLLDDVKGDLTGIGQSLLLNELDQKIELYYKLHSVIEGSLSVEIRATDMEETNYAITARAQAVNTLPQDEDVYIIFADYSADGVLTSVIPQKATVPSRTGETVEIVKQLPYDSDKDYTNTKVFLMSEKLVPLTEAVLMKDLEVKRYFDEEVYNMAPTRESAENAVRSANDYWQSRYNYNQTQRYDIAFWANSAYHAGNIEAYKLTGDEKYLQYSTDWANAANWQGNTNTDDLSTWGDSYDESKTGKNVLFGDWQACFQSYIDLFNLGVEGADLDRVYEVMDYQISTEKDSYWWWADALFMVMPTMTKLYKLTGDEKYLDKLYEYFRYSKELMYDGEDGIPEEGEEYTTSAYLRGGAQPSNPDDYKHLFYRDAGYVYPLNANKGHENEKNFWARGNGWVFAGLAKVLSDMPEDYAHYDEFYNTYMELAEAIIACQVTDEEGHGFWTQSMLQDYPKGSNGNDYGYETSGTAFFTYGLFWGINNGYLDEATYLEPAIRAWGYLSEVALQDDGMVGYVQEVGSKATDATRRGTTQDFGVGAFLLAGCEAARWGENSTLNAEGN